MEVFSSSSRTGVKADTDRLPPFWHPEGEIYIGGFHALP